MEISIESYKLMRDTGDALLLDFLEGGEEKENFKKHKKEVLEILDPYNFAYPGELIIRYYNYCLENFKEEDGIK